MKKFAFILIILVLFTVPAFADFLNDYNFYAENVFGLNQLEFVKNDTVMAKFSSGISDLFVMRDSIIVSSENHLDAISSACCVLRCVDNTGSQLDQYGRVLHAYYLSKAASGELKTATTKSGFRISASIQDNILMITVDD